MKIKSLNRLRSGLLAAFAAALFWYPVAVTASVKVIADWRMGENDAGAADEVPVTNSIDNIGSNNLAFAANSTYSAFVAPIAATRVNSTLSINLVNQSYGLAATIVTNSTDHFGIEAWVDPLAVDGTSQVIAYNGNSGNSGWGIFINSDNNYSALYGGHAIITGTPVQSGIWSDVALVRNSPNTVLYVNGVAVATNTTAVPATPSGGFAVGATPQTPTGQFFTGLVDEVRVFTFAAGQFTTNDLLVNAGPPSTRADTATPLTSTSSSLNGYVFPNGADTTLWFQWGNTTNYGLTTAPIIVPASNNSSQISTVISGLSMGTTYHYALSITNAAGTNMSQDSTFTVGGFATTSNGPPNIAEGSVAFGDYDNDGALDLLITGSTNFGPFFGGTTQLWRNNGDGTFSKIETDLPALENSTAVWGDYDNDGRLDILLCGSVTNHEPIAQVWHNNANGSFSNNIAATFTGFAKGSAAWGDYDNDGRVDILIGGNDGKTETGEIWRNNGNGTFSNDVRILSLIPPLTWVDYDNDGMLDISQGGRLLHHNANGTFTAVTNLPGVESLAWGDYDNDGWPDILTAGTTNSVSTGEVTRIWHNNGNGTFTAVAGNLPGVSQSAVAWGDFDSDGRLDILITGTTNNLDSGCIMQLWHNNGDGTFSNVVNTGLPGISHASIACGDYHNDGRLGILLSGDDVAGNPLTQLWRNEFLPLNSVPQTPSGLGAYVSGTNVVFHWNRSSDPQTPTAALTYNLRVGSSPGGVSIVSPMSDPNNGLIRRIPQAGNAGTLTNKFIFAQGGTYYWSVQTVDNSDGTSSFAPEQSFKLLPTMTPVGATNFVPGDVNGDGLVDSNEVITVLSHLASDGTIGPVSLNLALRNYLGTYPLALSNVDGLGNSNILFNLPGFPNANLSVQSSTDLVNWQTLGPVDYGFTDTNAATNLQRFYRLSYP